MKQINMIAFISKVIQMYSLLNDWWIDWLIDWNNQYIAHIIMKTTNIIYIYTCACRNSS